MKKIYLILYVCICGCSFGGELPFYETLKIELSVDYDAGIESVPEAFITLKSGGGEQFYYSPSLLRDSTQITVGISYLNSLGEMETNCTTFRPVQIESLKYADYRLVAEKDTLISFDWQKYLKMAIVNFHNDINVITKAEKVSVKVQFRDSFGMLKDSDVEPTDGVILYSMPLDVSVESAYFKRLFSIALEDFADADL